MKYNFLRHNLHDDVPIYRVMKELEKTYGIPLYIYNGSDACENALEVHRHFGKTVRLSYAVKANCYLAESLTDVVENFEVCTKGELEFCLHNRIPAEKISYSGVWKSEQEVRRALDAGVRRFILDSVNQIRMLQEVADQKVEVLLRLSSGNQFGMNIEEIAQITAENDIYSKLSIVGIHYYAGTQRQFAYQIEEDFGLLTKGLQYLKEKGIRLMQIQLGGGMGVALYRGDSIQRYEEMADRLFDFVKSLSTDYQITYECGRVIASNAGRYITKVFEKKQRAEREILLVQGGSHHLKYHGNIVGQRQPFIDCVTKEERQGEQNYMVCGSLCTASDILSMRLTNSCIEAGDYMIFYHAGAYSLQEAASLFLSMAMPCILVYNGSKNEKKVLKLGWICCER